MLIKDNSKLVIIGDSVSDFERARPVGEGYYGRIGKSYVGIVDAFLKATYPASKIRVVNMGTSGNNVRDLEQRWQSDVFDLHPDWVAVLIGINDVWRQFDVPLLTEKHVPLDEYEATYERLIVQTKPAVKGLILMTPYYMEPNKSDPMRARMDEYGAVVKKLAKKHGAVLVDLQQAFDEYLQYYYPASITWDRIHPDVVGHMIIARAFLKAIGYEWEPKK